MRIQDGIVTIVSFLRQPRKRDLIREAYKLRDKIGLEIGGPTTFFALRGGFPVYLFAERVDNVNYGTETFFGNYKEGLTYEYYPGKMGKQFIAEATDLDVIANNSYDFILSSHSLEHTANPIKALMEWIKKIKLGGKLILVLPDKRNTFDHRREYTSFAHLLDDFDKNTTEHDSTHFEEIISTFDEEAAKVQIKEYKRLIKDNYINRCAHHHVFSQEVVEDVLKYVGFTVESQFEIEPFHLVTIASKHEYIRSDRKGKE